MMRFGMDVVRLNFSHGTHADHLRRIKTIRILNKKYRRHIRILQDLEGHRIRIGTFKNTKTIELRRKQKILLTNRPIPGTKEIIPFDYGQDLRDIKKGSHIFIDDGNIDLVVRSTRRDTLSAEIVVGGILKEHKGVNIPGVNLKFSPLSAKDRLDLNFGIAQGVDYIAQSFVRDQDDILLIRKIISRALPQCRIIAKIENREGIRNIDRILRASDGIMIARGDMGVSLPLYEIPIVQKEIIRKCNHAGKFVITATQMLESMTENPRPTRAEVTDVANAILDGSDLVMLSAETAAGKYPVAAVRMMNDIIGFTEKWGRLQ